MKRWDSASIPSTPTSGSMAASGAATALVSAISLPSARGDQSDGQSPEVAARVVREHDHEDPRSGTRNGPNGPNDAN